MAGAATTAGSSLMARAPRGSKAPERVEVVIWAPRATDTARAKVLMAMCSGKGGLKIGRTKRVIRAMQQPRVAPRKIPRESSLVMTLAVDPASNSPSDMARMTMVAAWPPVFPPAATTIGK